ncbi:unnamed protein product [Ilex paraguariensis]|uniref:RNase H type-1 domain-containing protein n=1 Tax=Ilex paraguariensis TaxID=185542 RepID=A0ABC8TPH0_9AQUA
MDFQIQHIYREGNSVADVLANQGVLGQAPHLYSNQGDLPLQIRLLLQHDQRGIKPMDFQIQHIYREGNSVADVLANQGVLGQAPHLYSNQGDLPLQIRLLLQHDQRGIKVVRKRFSALS